MRYFLHMSLLALSAFVIASCQPKEESCSPKASSTLVESDPSELALLMKAIHKDAKSWRNAIAHDSLSVDSLDIYLQLVSSTPTDAKVKGPAFEGFASLYQNAFDRLVEAADTDSVRSAYDALVATCVSCHTSYCPGPVATIEKLYFKRP